MPAVERDRLRVSSDLELLDNTVREAGRIALTYFGKAPRRWDKDGGSPVTDADIAVDRMLREELLSHRPDYGWLSEETDDDPDRLDRQKVFVVDPIDGTRGFIAGRDEWCVAVAIVEDGRPVTSALFNPVRDEVFRAERGGGATLSGIPIETGRRNDIERARIAGPRGLLNPGDADEPPIRPVPWIASLAYRLALVACGRLDATTVKPHSHDWDLAAADLLVHEAGGVLTTLDGVPPRYNSADVRHGVLVASGPHLYDALRDRVRRGAASDGGN